MSVAAGILHFIILCIPDYSSILVALAHLPLWQWGSLSPPVMKLPIRNLTITLLLLFSVFVSHPLHLGHCMPVRGRRKGSERSPPLVFGMSRDLPRQLESPGMNHMTKPKRAPPESSAQSTQSLQQHSTYRMSSDIDLISVLGEATKFQRLLLAHCMLAIMLSAINDQWPLVVAPQQDHWCAPPEHMNISTEAWKNMSIPIQEDGTYSQCEMYQEYNSSRPNRSTIRCTKWQYDETRNTGTVTQEWDMVCDLEWMHSSALAVQMGATLLGLLASGVLSDSIGRKPVVCFCSAASVIFSVGALNTASLVLYVCFRCGVTMSLSAVILPSYILVMELVPPSSRGLYGVLSFTGFEVGVTIARASRDMYYTWRTLQAMFLLLLCFLLGSFVLVEESPRWLISKWELKRAEEAVLAIAKVNGRKVEDARESWRSYKTLLKQGEGVICGMLDVSYTRILLQHRLLHANIILSYAWFATSFTFYGLTLVNTAEKDLHWAVILCILIPRQYIAYLCIEQFGRRPTLSYSALMTSGACVVASFITSGAEALRYVKMALRRLALSSIGVSLTVVLLYMVEMNPTSVRTISVCMCCIFCRLGGMLSILLVKLDVVPGEVTQMVLYALTCLVAGFLVTGLPETRMVILPEVIKREDILRIEPLRVEKAYKRRMEETTRSVTPVESCFQERSLRDLPLSSERTSRMNYLKDIHSAL
ncbi:solute carrier family 22 member 6-like isoform X2 [Ornithodoros turicata]|uniref:solute carrier family 22 member 6-like isoform X2 n=1 Tax=Ornithodoros turicata TaxID=34597 RepID=UPI00313A3534